MRGLDCKLIKATLCLLTHSHTLNLFEKHKLITYPHPPIPVIIPKIMVLIRASPISKFGAQHDHLIKTTNCQWKMGKDGATSWFLGTFFSCSTLLCVIMTRFRKNTPPFSDIHSIDMILIRSSQCSWRTEDEMKNSAILVGLGKQNSCLNYANVTAFLLNRSDSKSPTKLSSRKWHLRLDWQCNKFFGIKKTK